VSIRTTGRLIRLSFMGIAGSNPLDPS